MGRVLLIAVLAAAVSAAQTTPMRGIHTHYEWKPYSSKGEWEQRRLQLQQQILSSAGLDPMPPRSPLNARYVKQATTGMAAVDTVLLETLPGFYLGANLYKPLKAPAAKMPAVLIPHGHWANGRVENIPEYSMPALAMNLARQGYVVLTIDMVGYNDTKQLEHKFQSREMDLWSYTPLGLQLWNAIRAVDFLGSLPYVDTGRIAATGASGGGTQTFLLSAVDDRVKVAAPVNMISAYMQGGCVCEGAPGLRTDTFNVELAAIVAPRPMLMVSCTGDWTRNTPKEEFPLMQKMYELYDARARVENVHIDAPHNYNAASRAAVYRFLARYLQPSLSEAELVERPLTSFEPSDFLAGGSPATVSAEDLFTAWKNMSQEQARATRDVNILRDRMRRVFHLHRMNSRPLQKLWKPGVGQPRLIVHAGPEEVAPEMLNTNRPLLILPAYRHDNASAAFAPAYHTYNLAEGVLQVQDILRAVETLPGKESVEIVPVGNEMLAAALYASALSPRRMLMSAQSLEKAVREPFFVPGIERAGGTAAARRLMQ